jgi:hypothetical protein
MIQLASDPNTNRVGWRPAAREEHARAVATKRGRTGHPWPFISRQPAQPAPVPDARKSTGDSGS